MLDCIQTKRVNTEARDINKANISLRLSGPEAVRYWHVMDAAKERNPYIRLTDVIRELVGLNEPRVLSLDEVHFFQTGEKLGKFNAVTKIPRAEMTDETKTKTKTPLRKVK